MTEGGLGQHGDWLIKLGKCIDVSDTLDSVYGIWSDGHRSYCFLVAFMTDIDNLIALTRPDLYFVVHLRYEGANRVNDVATSLSRARDNFGSRAVSAEHDLSLIHI